MTIATQKTFGIFSISISKKDGMYSVTFTSKGDDYSYEVWLSEDDCVDMATHFAENKLG